MAFNYKNVNWVTFFVMSGYHLALLVCLPLYFIFFSTPSLGLLLISFIALVLTGFSITGGYHRFYSHSTFKLHSKIIETVILFFGALGISSSALAWSHNHRIHHRFVDTERDPYNIHEGFWHAHILWLFKKGQPINMNLVTDLAKNKLVMLQHNYYPSLVLATNAGFVILLGWLFNDYFGAFVFGCLLRLFLGHHAQFFINSIAHTWGSKPYSKEQSAVNNWVIALLTFGEGYHNFHHAFAGDYRNGIRWYQFDPTKFFIWSLARIGLASDLKTVDDYIIKKKLVTTDKHMMLEGIKELHNQRMKEFEVKINELSAQITTKINEATTKMREYKKMRQEKRHKKERDYALRLKYDIKYLRKSINHDFKAWVLLCKEVFHLCPHIDHHH